MSKIVRSRLDNSALSKEDQIALEKLMQMSDDQIDYSDIPELDNSVFERKAVYHPIYKPRKSSTTIRLDVDVLNWLKSQGKGYQTRINQILRTEMLKAIQAK